MKSLHFHFIFITIIVFFGKKNPNKFSLTVFVNVLQQMVIINQVFCKISNHEKQIQGDFLVNRLSSTYDHLCASHGPRQLTSPSWCHLSLFFFYFSHCMLNKGSSSSAVDRCPRGIQNSHSGAFPPSSCVSIPLDQQSVLQVNESSQAAEEMAAIKTS